VSPSVKFSAGVGKHALKLAVGDILPLAVLDRGAKMGFPVPLVEWMQHPQMSEFVSENILGSGLGGSTLIDPAAAERLLAEHRYSNRQLWGLLSLQMWHETFFHG
jgi:asparagine synthetase B (glutamine-hydrolysing)